jgi:hypothetical protein
MQVCVFVLIIRSQILYFTWLVYSLIIKFEGHLKNQYESRKVENSLFNKNILLCSANYPTKTYIHYLKIISNNFIIFNTLLKRYKSVIMLTRISKLNMTIVLQIFLKIVSCVRCTQNIKHGMMIHTSSFPRTQEAEAGGSWVQGQPGQHTETLF